MDFSGTELENVDPHNTDYSHTNLEGTSFRIQNPDSDGLNLQNLDFKRMNCSNMSFPRMGIHDAELGSLDPPNADSTSFRDLVFHEPHPQDLELWNIDAQDAGLPEIYPTSLKYHLFASEVTIPAISEHSNGETQDHDQCGMDLQVNTYLSLPTTIGTGMDDVYIAHSRKIEQSHAPRIQPSQTQNVGIASRVVIDDWEDYRPFIEQLYIEENMKLEEVMQVLKTKFGFEATIKMYKTQLTKWDLRKNYKATEKDRLARVIKNRRDTGRSVQQLSIRNRPAELHRVRRHCRNKNILKEIWEVLPAKPSSIVTSAPATSVFDPERPLSTASDAGRTELLLFQTRIYYKSQCVFGNEVNARSRAQFTPLDSNASHQPGAAGTSLFTDTWFLGLFNGTDMLLMGKSAIGWQLIQEASGLIHEALEEGQRNLLARFVFIYISLYSLNRFADLRMSLLRFWTKCSVLRFGCKHPLSIILFQLCNLRLCQHLIEATYNVMIDSCSDKSDSREYEALGDYLSLLLVDGGHYNAAESTISRFLRQSEQVYGPNAWRVRRFQCRLGDVYQRQGHLDFAISVYKDCLQRGHIELGDAFPDNTSTDVLQILALAYEEEGDFGQSERYWYAAMSGAVKVYGVDGALTWSGIVHLEYSFRRQGQDPEAWLQQNFGLSTL